MNAGMWRRVGAVVLLAMLVFSLAAFPVAAQAPMVGPPAITDTTHAVAGGAAAVAAQAWLSAHVMLVMLAWGILHKYFPPLAKVPNALIPWFNLGGYLLAQLVGTANADVLHGVLHALPGFLSVVIAGASNAGLTSVLYERFGRPVLEGVLGWSKAVPKAVATAPPSAAAPGV